MELGGQPAAGESCEGLKRSPFLKRAAIRLSIVLAVAGLAGCDAQQLDRRHATGATAEMLAIMPPENALGTAPYDLASEVAALTGGSLRFEVRQAGDIGVAIDSAFDLVDAGTYQALVAPPEIFMIQGSHQPWGVLLTSGTPFGFRAGEFLAWYYHGGGEHLVQTIYDRKSAHANVLVMPVAMTAGEPPGFFVDAVPDDPDAFDASGITYRINLLGHKVMKEAFPGLNVVTSPVGAVPVDDFCTGKLQGAELGTAAMYEDLFFDGFDHPNGGNVVECGFSHLYLSSWQQLMLSSWLAINREFFESLEPHEQQAIVTSAQANAMRTLARDFAGGGAALARVAEAGATIHAGLPPEILARLRETTARQLQAEAAADADFDAIVSSMGAFARANHGALLYDGIPQDERFNLFPGWDPDHPVVRD